MRVLLIASLLAACGDNTTPADPLFTGLSGSRIKLQWYLYQDGSREREPAAFYDAHLHARCAPEPWIDGATRCTPLADDAVFTDAACTLEVGRTNHARTPKFFVRRELVDGEQRVAGVVRAGAKREERPSAFFERRDGACTAIPEPETIYYWDVGAEVTDLTEVWTEMIAGERLGLQTLASLEGLSSPIGYHDAQLGIACRPADLADGTAACVPASPTRPAHFIDPYCEVPAVVADAPPPAIVVDLPTGCPAYHAAGAAITGVVYAREGASCVVAGTQTAAYRVGAPLALAPMQRIREHARGQRLQRIRVLGDGEHTLDTRLFDTATGRECHSFGNGELAMCIPASALAGARVYANATCTREVLVADVPRVQCERSTFAIVEDASIHQIGAPAALPLFTLDDAGCRPRREPRDAVPFLLGPPIPPETFVAGVVFSER